MDIYDELTEIFRLLGTTDPALALHRLKELRAVALSALQIRQATSDSEVARATAALYSASANVEWLATVDTTRQ